MNALTDVEIIRIRDESFSKLSQDGIVFGYEADLAFARAVIAASFDTEKEINNG